MKRLPVYMALIAVLLFSCNRGSTESDKPAQTQLPGPDDQNKPKDAAAGEPQSTKNFTAAATKENINEQWDKKIIKIADVNLEIKDYAAYNQSIHSGLKAYGAYISAEEQTSNDYRKMNQITIKVPVAQFENLMNSFSGDGIKVLQRKISSDDVSGEVVDTRSRMEARKQTRDRYLALLKQARNMKEILEVQSEINSIQEDIEAASGRVSFLNHQSAYSTIHLSYFQYIDGGIKPDQTPGYLLRLTESFNTGVRFVGGLFVLLVTLWPVILGSTIAFILWKKRKKPARQA